MISTIQLNNFLLYALAFRLAIIAVGMLSIVLGYRLFAKSSPGRGGATAELKAGGVRVSLANAAPGTCFALFGVAVIVVMLWQGIPELQISDSALTGTPDVNVEVRAPGAGSMIVKGEAPGSPPAFEEQLRRAAALQQNDRREEAAVEYFRSLAVPNTSLSQGARAQNANGVGCPLPS